MSINCTLCFHNCRLEEGQTGLCRARGNRGGKIVPLNYGKLTALALDPIEKKPSAPVPSRQHGAVSGQLRLQSPLSFLPERRGLPRPGIGRSPPGIGRRKRWWTRHLRLRSQGNIGVAYTYNEPLVGYEYVQPTVQRWSIRRGCAMCW